MVPTQPTVRVTGLSSHDDRVSDDTLTGIEKKVRWLATSMINHANRVRPNRSGLKVGGH
jgi:pyruvate dehydrogenase E1 component